MYDLQYIAMPKLYYNNQDGVVWVLNKLLIRIEGCYYSRRYADINYSIKQRSRWCWPSSDATAPNELSWPLWCSLSCIGGPLLCFSLWKEKSRSVLPVLNLVGVAGFIVGPLIVAPFLSPETTDFSNQTFRQGPGNATDNTPLPARSKVIYAFVIVALCSLFVGLSMLFFSIQDLRITCDRKSNNLIRCLFWSCPLSHSTTTSWN